MVFEDTREQFATCLEHGCVDCVLQGQYFNIITTLQY